MTYHAIGAVEDIGLSRYKISGDPVIALVAQINRFAGKTVSTGNQPGNIEALKAGTQRAGCTDRVFLKTPLPLIPSITPNGANTASTIVWQRYACAQIGLDSPKKESWAYNGVLTGSDSRAFVLANIAEITITLAQYADSLGLEPAKVGITEVDPRIARKFPTVTVVILGALALAAAVMYGRSR